MSARGKLLRAFCTRSWVMARRMGVGRGRFATSRKTAIKRTRRRRLVTVGFGSNELFCGDHPRDDLDPHFSIAAGNSHTLRCSLIISQRLRRTSHPKDCFRTARSPAQRLRELLLYLGRADHFEQHRAVNFMYRNCGRRRMRKSIDRIFNRRGRNSPPARRTDGCR